MSKVAIMTDSSSGFTVDEAKNLGITVITLPFIIDGEEYLENSNLTRDEFYEKLESNSNISTSQPSQEIIKNCWNNLLKEYDQVVYIPLSSGLSATCKSSQQSATEYNGKVEVIDNKRVSVTLKVSCLTALKLAQEGKTAQEIKQSLETDTYNSSIYITVTTLKYLKKGGRITAAAAAIGSLLKIKPVLQIQGEKLDSFAKVLTIQQAKQKMINAVQKDLDTRFKKYYENNEMCLAVAYTGISDADGKQFENEIKNKFPNIEFSFTNSLPSVITCHIGPGAIAVALIKKYKNCLDLLNY